MVYQSVCNLVVGDAGKEALPAPVIPHWIGLDSKVIILHTDIQMDASTKSKTLQRHFTGVNKVNLHMRSYMSLYIILQIKLGSCSREFGGKTEFVSSWLE